MKKLNLLFTAILLLCCVGTAKAVEVTIDGIKYDIITDTKQATVISGDTKYAGDIVIPSEITYNNVTCSVTSIGESAFLGCWGLTSITIPNSVTSIGEKAFDGCYGLTSITIGSSVTSIGNGAFNGCNGLKEVHINDLVAWCNIDFEDSDANPLYYAHNLYLNNELITELVIPNGVTSIKNNAFFGCSGLTSVTIPNSVTSIGENAFYGCSKLTSITIPNSVTSIESYAFFECYGLTSVTIGNSVTSIGEKAFSWCKGLESIVVDPGNTKYDSRENCNAIIETESNALIAGCKNTVIPNSVTSIGYAAFSNCDGLTSITIPNSVTSIGYAAFSNCDGLTSVTIGNSVTSIGGYAFNSCSGLTSITIPNSVTSIGDWAFHNCYRLTSITIPNSVTSIGKNAFYNCDGLKTVINLSNLTFSKGSTDYGYIAYYANKVYNITNGSIEGDYIFDKLNNVNTLLFYLGNETELTLPADYKGEGYAIGENVFKDNKTITSIEIPNSVTSIRNSAFSGCSGLTSITIGSSVTSIGYGAFFYCDGLESIVVDPGNTKYDSRENCNAIIETESNALITGCKNTVIPNSVTSIGEQAFYNCEGLTSITIPNSVTSIGNYAFSNCSGLTSITIGSSVTSIGYMAFSYCSGLTSITIPNSVTSIDYNAFDSCDGLTSITIPNSVTSIGGGAFRNCKNLTDVYCFATNVPATRDEWGDYNPFEGSYPQYITLHVPAKAINSYKTAESWSEFGTIVALDDETINPEPEPEPNPVRQEINLTTEAGLPGYISSPHDHAVINPTSPSDQGGVAAMIDDDVNTHFHTAWENVPAGPHYFEIDMGEGNTIGKFSFDYVTRNNCTYDWAREFTIKGSNNGTNFELITVVDFGTNVKNGSSHSSEVLGSNDKTYRYLRFEVTNTNSIAGAVFRTYFHIAEFDLFAINDPQPKPEVKVCATPTISYNNGELAIECETTDAEFVTEVTSNDFNKFYSDKITFSATYNISVYATATGHDNSDTVNATLCWIECDCSANDNTSDVINVPAKAVLVTSNNGTININCALEGEVVELYTSDAVYIGNTTIENGCATIESGLSKGDIAIIKIAEKSIKVILN